MKMRFSYRWGLSLTVLLAFSIHCRGMLLEEPESSGSVPAGNVEPDSPDALSLPDPVVTDPVFSLDEEFEGAFFDEFMGPGEAEDLESVYEVLALQASGEEGMEVEERVGGWRKNLFPYFRVGGYYDDNIFIQESPRESDFIGFAGFGLRFGLGEVVAPLYNLREKRHVPVLYDAPLSSSGNFIWADYSGIYRLFTDHPELSSYDQDAMSRLAWSDGKLTLGFEGRFQSLSTPDIDAGGRVRRYIFHAGVDGYYQWSDLTSFEANFSYTNTQYTGLIDSSEFINENWLNYQITPKLKIGPGIGVGVLMMQGGPNQPYGRVLMRAVYEYSAKLSFSGRLGLEYRDVQEGSAFRNNPVFGVGVTYAPRDGTSISLQGYRFAEASALLAGADYTITGVEMEILQRFLQRFFITLTGGYQNLNYHLVSGDSSPRRNDNYFFGRAAIAFDITKWCNAEIFYSYQRDSSTRPGNSFRDNQVGIGFDFAF